MTFSIIQAQADTTAFADTLTQSYSNTWDGSTGLEHSGPIMKAAASHDLIFIVLGVSLIIWFLLLFFIIRVDKKVGKLENELQQTTKKQDHET